MKYLLYLGGLIVVLAVSVWFISLPDMNNTAAVPSLMRKWDDQVYGLDDGEMVRLVAPPFTVSRTLAYASAMPALGKATGQMAYEVRPTGVHRWGAGMRPGTVASALRWCSERFPGDLNGSDFDAPGALASLIVDGDWVVRNDQPVESRLPALQSIISQVTRRNLVIEKRLTEMDVIVARGKWAFHPVEGLNETMRTGIQMYAEGLQSKSMSMFAEIRATPPDFLNSIGRFTGRTVIDETDGQWPHPIAWYSHASAQKAARDDSARAALLANLQKQTSLTFIEEKRVMPVWFIEDKAASTQPAGGK